MKQNFSLFLLLTSVFFFFRSQTAKADYVDDYITQPLTIEYYSTGVSGTATSGQFKIYYVGKTSSASSSTSKTTPNLQYRLQTYNPTTKTWSAWGDWTSLMTNGTTQLKALASGISVSALTLGGGSSPYKQWRVQLRGVNRQGWSTSTSNYFTISLESAASSRNFTVSGNVMSLIVGYDTSDETAAQATLAAADSIPKDYCFYRLFHYISTVSNVANIDASHLIFPATKLKTSCYQDLFYDAKSLTTYGLTAGPTFLATDFVDTNGDKVSTSFAGLCKGCKKLSSIHVNFQHCYEANEGNLTDWLKTGATSPYPTLYAPEAFRTCAVNNSGLSDAVWNNWTKTEWSYEIASIVTTHTVTLADDATGYGSINESSITEVEDGATITIDGNTLTIGTTTVTATPTTANAQYTYTFTGWYNGEDQLTGSSNTVTADMTITAHFTRTTNTYTITWQNEDGTTLETDENVAYGTTPTYDGETPTKTAAGYTYTFSGWTPTITAVTGNTTYTAQFDAVAATTLDLYDDQDATYYNSIKALNGQTYDVTYHRSVKYESDGGSARWYTLCLPFGVDQSQLTNAGLLRKVYEYRYATGSADVGDQVTFHFRVATSMVAGQGYLVKTTGDMGPDFTFTSITLNTSADVVNGNVDNLKNSNAYKESGDIAIVGVLRNGTLSAAGKQVMGLANNKIWYPHSSGNPMPAYRAYFYNPSASASSVMPRVRIVVEGEGTTELEVVDGELLQVIGEDGTNADGDIRAPRKYIRNGVLIIERNGERYNAQGARM